MIFYKFIIPLFHKLIKYAKHGVKVIPPPPPPTFFKDSLWIQISYFGKNEILEL